MCHIVTRRRPTDPPPDDERKERVIHTRVPERLEAELRERAQELGVSVSNLVRNVLGHAFGLVGDVVADSHAIARAARGERPPAPAAAVTSIDDVLGWQPIVLAKNALCGKCNAILPKGKDAAVGVGSQLVVCPSCLKELRS
jgi:hypothetical protein